MPLVGVDRETARQDLDRHVSPVTVANRLDLRDHVSRSSDRLVLVSGQRRFTEVGQQLVQTF